MKVTDPKFNPSDRDGVTAIKMAALHLQEVIEEHTPPGRRRSTALTYLEISAMFAVKSAVVGDED